MKYFLFFFFFSFAFFSCEKEGIITGTLVDACGNPLDSARVNLINLNTGKTIAKSTTNQNGFFSIPYKTKISSLALEHINFPNPTVLIKKIPTKKHIDFDLINSSIIFSLNIRLEVSNPYTINDTLFVDIQGGTQPVHFEIPGPFVSGIADSLMGQIFTNYPYKYNEKPSITYSYKFSKHPKVFHSKKAIHSCTMNEIVFKID